MSPIQRERIFKLCMAIKDNYLEQHLRSHRTQQETQRPSRSRGVTMLEASTANAGNCPSPVFTPRMGDFENSGNEAEHAATPPTTRPFRMKKERSKVNDSSIEAGHDTDPQQKVQLPDTYSKCKREAECTMYQARSGELWRICNFLFAQSHGFQCW